MGSKRKAKVSRNHQDRGLQSLTAALLQGKKQAGTCLATHHDVSNYFGNDVIYRVALDVLFFWTASWNVARISSH